VTDYQTHAVKLKVMSHPVRLQILDMLRQGEMCVCHIEKALGRRQAYISQQLMTLREAGLVDSRKDGLQVYYWLADDVIAHLLDTLYGEAEYGQTIIEGCTCPVCTTISTEKI